MADNKRYYWLKLKSDFFDNLRMKKLRTIAGGDTYTIIYLKMQLLSLQDDGFLYYEGVEDSFEQEIALIINENVEDVKLTIAFLCANNLLNEVEKGKYELIETRTCIGSETDKAEFMRNLREKRNKEKIKDSNIVTNVLPPVTNCYTEKEKEIEIEKELEIEIEKKKELIDEIVNIYSRECFKLPQIRTITETRKKAIKSFLKTYKIEDWEEVCKIANNCDFLIGINDRGWKADFDFLIKVNNAVKVLEGKYTGNNNKFKTNNPFMEILESEGEICRDMT